MARGDVRNNRFANAGKALVESSQTVGSKEPTKEQEQFEKDGAEQGTVLKNKVVTAKVYPETWATFTAINRAQGMTNNSVINMLISEYVRNHKEILN